MTKEKGQRRKDKGERTKGKIQMTKVRGQRTKKKGQKRIARKKNSPNIFFRLKFLFAWKFYLPLNIFVSIFFKYFVWPEIFLLTLF